MTSQKTVTDKVAIVTGAAHRIGAAIVRHLHDQQYNVLVHYRNSSAAANALVDQLNDLRENSAVGVQAELTESTSAGLITEACVNKWGRLDLLVNNASEFFPTPIGSIANSDFQKLFGCNVQAPLMLSQAAYSHLQKTQGSVINIVDIYAGTVHKGHPVYCASKAALAMLTKSLAVELAPSVRVNGISPGAILWPDGEEKSQAQKDQMVIRIPLNTMGTPLQIAEAVMYLANADFVTGQILALDGGRTL